MDKNRPETNVPAVKCFVNTGSRLLSLDSGPEAQLLGHEKMPGGSALTYGQYLDAVSGLLVENSFHILRQLLSKGPKPFPPLEKASSIELIAEKHGALYSVSRLRVGFGDTIGQFAVNCAFSPEQQAFLQVETALLSELAAKFNLDYLPSPIIRAEAPGLMVFLAQWFSGHHEFHLCAKAAAEPAIKIWDNDNGQREFIGADKSCELYVQATKILTSYLDLETFSQIYPWHHAAGDFIIDQTQSPVSVRLITARGYRSLLSKDFAAQDKMLGSLHFFLNLCIRMRLDRLDGVGELAWAGANCLDGILRGFMEAWETKQKDTVPKAEEIFALFKALSPEERLAFAQVAAQEGMIEADETDFLAPRLPSCMAELAKALEHFGF
ncbi:MAG: hypothetical protein ACP5IL_02130 [Syntrophobacteraceae bacterium]